MLYYWVCFRNHFTIGKLDTRQSIQHQFSAPLLQTPSVIMVSIVGFKLLAPANMASLRVPKDHDTPIVRVVGVLILLS